jgi:uncharacterized membrane protein YvbJ
MYCSNCGKELNHDARFCNYCGRATDKQGEPVAARTYAPHSGDEADAGFGVLSFFFPLIGLILFLVWHEEKPLKAKSCGRGAIAGCIVSVVLAILAIIVPFVMTQYMLNDFTSLFEE